MVQYIDRIHTDLELLRFCNPHTLDQVHIQLAVTRAYDRVQTESADRSRLGIDEEKIALSVSDRFIGDGCVRSLQRCDIGSRIRDLQQAREVEHTVCCLGYVPHAMGEIAGDIRTDTVVCQSLGQCREVGRDLQRVA